MFFHDFFYNFDWLILKIKKFKNIILTYFKLKNNFKNYPVPHYQNIRNHHIS